MGQRKGSTGRKRPDLAERNRLRAKHGMTDSPEHSTWTAMRERCLSPRCKNYVNYGGRGITIDPQWDTFAAFYADMGPRPPGTTLERVNNNAGYGPGNCRWATAAEQSVNKRTTKLSRDDVRRIIRYRAAGAKLRMLAAQFGVAESMISRIYSGTRRRYA